MSPDDSRGNLRNISVNPPPSRKNLTREYEGGNQKQIPPPSEKTEPFGSPENHNRAKMNLGFGHEGVPRLHRNAPRFISFHPPSRESGGLGIRDEGVREAVREVLIGRSRPLPRERYDGQKNMLARFESFGLRKPANRLPKSWQSTRERTDKRAQTDSRTEIGKSGKPTRWTNYFLKITKYEIYTLNEHTGLTENPDMKKVVQSLEKKRRGNRIQRMKNIVLRRNRLMETEII